MSLAGAVGGHSVVCHIIATFGTEDQKRRYLPRLATGEVRAAMALTEPGGGSDLQGMRTTASETPNGWRVNGSKTWITNGRRADLVALLCKTDPAADPVHRGISVLLAERGEGFSVARDLPKLGYKGIESSELVFDNFFLPYDAVLGGKPGKGFSHMMRGLELGRVQVAARAVGVARAAFEEAIAYSQERETFGKPIWQHQSIANHLAVCTPTCAGVTPTTRIRPCANASAKKGPGCDPSVVGGGDGQRQLRRPPRRPDTAAAAVIGWSARASARPRDAPEGPAGTLTGGRGRSPHPAGNNPCNPNHTVVLLMPSQTRDGSWPRH